MNVESVLLLALFLGFVMYDSEWADGIQNTVTVPLSTFFLTDLNVHLMEKNSTKNSREIRN